MGTKDLPIANAQPPHDGFSFLCAKLGVRIHRGHQDGCILIVLSLLCGKAIPLQHFGSEVMGLMAPFNQLAPTADSLKSWFCRTVFVVAFNVLATL